MHPCNIAAHNTVQNSKENQVVAMLVVFSRVSLPNSEILCLTRTPSLQNRLKTKGKQKRKGKGGGKKEKTGRNLKKKHKNKKRRKKKQLIYEPEQNNTMSRRKNRFSEQDAE
jgi:hypothetical protein